MGLDLSLSAFISAGGGLAYVLVALLWAASSGRPRHRLLFASFVGAQGIGVVVQSLTTPEETGPVSAAAVAGPYILATAGVLTALFAAALALTLASETSRRAMVTVGSALTVLAVMASAFLLQGGITPGKGDPAMMPAYTRIVFAIVLVSYAASAVVVLAMALHWKRHASSGTAQLAFATAILPLGFLVANAARTTPEALLGGFAVACIFWWLPPWGKGEPRVGRTVLLGLLAWALFMEVYYLVPFLRATFGAAFSPFEVAASLAMAIALFKHHPWGASPPRVAERRGPLAAAALAALFIVAQVAQEFLAAEYGLLMGGIVAGALLFAASPVQRAMERMSDGRGPPAAREADPTARGSPPAAIATHRDAVRYAMRDGSITRKEEAHLADLAQHLGIGAGDAMRARHEVEDEREERA